MSLVDYGWNKVKELFRAVPAEAPSGTILMSIDGEPLRFKKQNPWILKYHKRAENGDILYWPELERAASPENPKIFNLRIDAPLTAINENRYSSTCFVHKKKWVQNGTVIETQGEHKDKTYKHGKWVVPGISITGTPNIDYPYWITESYKLAYPNAKRKTKRKAPSQLPPPPIPSIIPPLPPPAISMAAPAPAPAPAPAADGALDLPDLPSSPVLQAMLGNAEVHSPPRASTISSVPPSPALSFGVWDIEQEMDVDELSFGITMTDEIKELLLESIKTRTKKQLTTLINRQFHLKWESESTKISAENMKKAVYDALCNPRAIYCHSDFPVYRMYSKDVMSQSIPLDTIKLEIEKFLRKMGRVITW